MRFHPLACLLLLAAPHLAQAQYVPPSDPPGLVQQTDTPPLYDMSELVNVEAPVILDGENWSDNGQALSLPAHAWLIPLSLLTNPDDGLTDEAHILYTGLKEIPADKPRSIALYLDRLQNLQDAYTRLDRLDEAEAIREKLDEYKAPQSKAQTNPGNLSAFRGQIGKTFLFTVRGNSAGPLYGDKIYTDDSDLDIVAVHAGLLREGQTGLVKVTILGGQAHYNGAERNGVASRSYEKWDGSYRVEAVAPAPDRPKVDALPQDAKDVLSWLNAFIPSPLDEQRIRDGINSLRNIELACAGKNHLDPALACRDARLYFVGGKLGALPDPGQLTSYRDKTGQSFYFYVQGRSTNSIWGDGVYTDDSSLSAVAIHAGLLHSRQKGLVKVTLLPGQTTYEGAERNGIVSPPYPSWTGSYRVENVPF